MRQDAVGIAKQTGSGAGGQGTENTTMAYWVPVETADRGPQLEDMEVDETLGHPFPSELERGVRYFAPQMAGRARGASLPLLLASFLGDPATTTPDAGGAPTARNHNFEVVARPTPRALSIAMLSKLAEYGIGTADLYTILWDAIGQELTLSVGMNEWIGFDAGFVAKEYDDAQSVPSPGADTSRRFPFYECLAYVSVNGAAEAELKVRDFSVTFGLNVPTDDAVLGSQKLYRVMPGNRTAEISFTAAQKADEYFKRAIAVGDQDNLKVRLEALGPVIGAAVRHKVELIAHNVQITESPLDIDAGEITSGTEVSGRCAYAPSTSKFVEANVVNTVASY